MQTQDIKAIARALRAHLAERGVTLSHAQALEATARAVGYRSYDVAAARADEHHRRQAHRGRKTAYGTVSAYLEVYLPTLLPAYERPEQMPEWRWIEANASFVHTGNGVEKGVWEYQCHVPEDKADWPQDIPARLRPVFEDAWREGCGWVLFHQG